MQARREAIPVPTLTATAELAKVCAHVVAVALVVALALVTAVSILMEAALVVARVILAAIVILSAALVAAVALIAPLLAPWTIVILSAALVTAVALVAPLLAPSTSRVTRLHPSPIYVIRLSAFFKIPSPVGRSKKMASKSELPLYVESPGWFRRRRLFVALGGASVIYCLCFFAFTLHDLRLTEQVLTQHGIKCAQHGIKCGL